MSIAIERSAERPVRLYLIGDSHVLPYRDLLVHEKFTDRRYFAVTKYIPGFAARDFSTDEGDTLSADLIAALAGENLWRNGQPTLRSTALQDLATGYAAGTAAIPPIVMIFAGDIDLRGHFLPQLGDKYDIVLPFDTHHPAVPGAQILPYEIARRRVEEYLAPLIAGVSALYAQGFKRIFIHGLAPPTLNQDLFGKLHGFRCALETRYKATRLFNKVLADMCAAKWIYFIDNWPQVTTDAGLLRPEFELDGVHLNREAAYLSLESVLEIAINHTYHCVNPLRYELAGKLAAPPAAASGRTGADVGAAVSDFHKTGFCQVELDDKVIETIERELDFRLDVGNRHARVDWYGTPVAAFSPLLRTAQPSQDVLDRVYALLHDSRIEQLVEGCAGHAVQYVNCRPVMSLPHDEEGRGPQEWHTDGCPPDILRAILYLVDVDADGGPFSYLSEGGTEMQLIGPRGTLALFDANRLRHRATPPKKAIRKVLDFVITSRMRSQPRRVLWAGLNAWPGDPFQYSVNGMRASPALTSPEISVNPLTG